MLKDNLIINKEVTIINGTLKGLKGILVGAHLESSIVIVLIDDIEFQVWKSDIEQN